MAMDKDLESLLQRTKSLWNELTITNGFVFGKAMQNPELCKNVLEAVTGNHIGSLVHIGSQEELNTVGFGRSVRPDVYARDDQGRRYAVEMHVTDTHDLPERARYYSSVMTVGQLYQSESLYDEPDSSYVVFICTFDPLGLDRQAYEFAYRCDEDPSLVLDDRRHTTLLVAGASSPHDNARLDEFLDYVSAGKVTGELSSELDGAVSQVIHDRESWLEFLVQAMEDKLKRDADHS